MIGKRFLAGAFSGAIALALYYIIWFIAYIWDMSRVGVGPSFAVVPVGFICGGIVGAITGGFGGMVVGSIFQKYEKSAHIGGVVFAAILAIVPPCAFMGGC
jgi:hypothetical protein